MIVTSSFINFKFARSFSNARTRYSGREREIIIWLTGWFLSRYRVYLYALGWIETGNGLEVGTITDILLSINMYHAMAPFLFRVSPSFLSFQDDLSISSDSSRALFNSADISSVDRFRAIRDILSHVQNTDKYKIIKWSSCSSAIWYIALS